MRRLSQYLEFSRLARGLRGCAGFGGKGLGTADLLSRKDLAKRGFYEFPCLHESNQFKCGTRQEECKHLPGFLLGKKLVPRHNAITHRRPRYFGGTRLQIVTSRRLVLSQRFALSTSEAAWPSPCVPSGLEPGSCPHFRLHQLGLFSSKAGLISASTEQNLIQADGKEKHERVCDTQPPARPCCLRY